MSKPSVLADPVGGTNDTSSRSSSSSFSERKTFLTTGLEDCYVPIDTYEGRHRFDPAFVWREEEEKKIVRKVSIFRLLF